MKFSVKFCLLLLVCNHELVVTTLLCCGKNCGFHVVTVATPFNQQAGYFTNGLTPASWQICDSQQWFEASKLATIRVLSQQAGYEFPPAQDPASRPVPLIFHPLISVSQVGDLLLLNLLSLLHGRLCLCHHRFRLLLGGPLGGFLPFFRLLHGRLHLCHHFGLLLGLSGPLGRLLPFLSLLHRRLRLCHRLRLLLGLGGPLLLGRLLQEPRRRRFHLGAGFLADALHRRLRPAPALCHLIISAFQRCEDPILAEACCPSCPPALREMVTVHLPLTRVGPHAESEWVGVHGSTAGRLHGED